MSGIAGCRGLQAPGGRGGGSPRRTLRSEPLFLSPAAGCFMSYHRTTCWLWVVQQIIENLPRDTTANTDHCSQRFLFPTYALCGVVQCVAVSSAWFDLEFILQGDIFFQQCPTLLRAKCE